MAGTVGADAGIAEKGSGPEREISKEIVFKSLVFNRAFCFVNNRILTTLTRCNLIVSRE